MGDVIQLDEKRRQKLRQSQASQRNRVDALDQQIQRLKETIARINNQYDRLRRTDEPRPF